MPAPWIAERAHSLIPTEKIRGRPASEGTVVLEPYSMPMILAVSLPEFAPGPEAHLQPCLPGALPDVRQDLALGAATTCSRTPPMSNTTALIAIAVLPAGS